MKRELLERVIVPTMMYGPDTWGMWIDEIRNLKVVELKRFSEHIQSDKDG